VIELSIARMPNKWPVHETLEIEAKPGPVRRPERLGDAARRIIEPMAW